MKTGQSHKLLYNFSSLSIIQAVNFLLALVVIPHVVRRVGAEGFGVIAVAQVVIFYLAALTDYGFNRTATRDIAIRKNEPGMISRIFFTVLAAKFLISLVCFLVLIFLLQVVPLFRLHYELYFLAFSFVLGQVFLVNWFYQGMEKMQYMAFAGLFSRMIFVILVLFFIQGRGDASLFIFFLGAGNLAAGIVSIIIAIRLYDLKFIRPSFSDILSEIKNGWPVTITNLSMISCQYIGVVILRLFTNDTLTGYYSIAEKIYFAMKQMMEIFSQAVYPRVCLLIRRGREEVFTFFRRTYLPFLLLVICSSSLVFIFSPGILHFFIGKEYLESVTLLRGLCFAVILVCLNIPPGLILFAGNHKRSYLKIFTMGTALNILGNLLLAPFLEATGTVISVLVTEFFITAGLSREAHRHYSTGETTPLSG